MSSVGIGFAILWMAVAFFILRFVAIRFFDGTGRAEVASLAIVVAFAAGAVWPFSERIGAVTPPAASPVPVAVVPPPPAATSPEPPGAHRATGTCRATANLAIGGVGSLDVTHGIRDQTPVRDGAVLPANAPFVLQGWAASLSANRLAATVCLVVDGRIEPRAAVTYGSKRSDVATTLHAPALESSGFRIVVPSGAVAPGIHQIAVAVESRGGGFNIIPGARGFQFR